MPSPGSVRQALSWAGAAYAGTPGRSLRRVRRAEHFLGPGIWPATVRWLRSWPAATLQVSLAAVVALSLIPQNATALVRVPQEVTGSVPSRAGARPWLRDYGFPVLSRDQETQLIACRRFGVLNLGPKWSSDRLPGRPTRRGGGTRPGSVSLMPRQPAQSRYRRCRRKPARLQLRARQAHKRRSAARPGRLPRPLLGPRAALPMLAAAPG